MLFSIGTLLIASTLIIIFAGSLTSLDVSAINNIDRLDTLISETETKLSNTSDILAWLRTQADFTTSLDTRTEAAKRLAESIGNTNYSQLPHSLDGATKLIDAETALLADYKTLLSQAWTKELSSEHGYSDTKYLIATAVTMVGVVLIIIFLVQILIGLYRYNTRLITYYLARRAVLQLWDGNIDTLEVLKQTVTPIDFGKEPKHPIDDIINRIISKIPGFGSSTGQGEGGQAL
jgi:hypothetical protein